MAHLCGGIVLVTGRARCHCRRGVFTLGVCRGEGTGCLLKVRSAMCAIGIDVQRRRMRGRS